jgi:hypothetical protein
MRLIRVQLISTKSTRWFPVGTTPGSPMRSRRSRPGRARRESVVGLPDGNGVA